MADAYWRYAAADPRQQQQQPPPPSAGGGVAHPGMGGGAPQMAPALGQQQQPMKRPRPADFSDVPGAPDMTGYYPRDEERAGKFNPLVVDLLENLLGLLWVAMLATHIASPSLPPDIFRPFVGFREPGGDPIVLCFVDFAEPTQSAIAMEALQGYKFDEHDRNSPNLRLQFARFTGPRGNSGPGGGRGRR
ncbi:unnamed protein product [Miscanthus lutarioriparius]|uniref:RRM domain-containing protein n=1 Tax=Miscanthus lutarioriparius TaxID=422564 RepID=A0A811S6N9_9POAL|nr:unnamed protein product [Miscanthus lutarioriparius]